MLLRFIDTRGKNKRSSPTFHTQLLNSSSPRLSPGKLLLLLGWSFDRFLLLVWVLQVTTPDGGIYSASRFTTMVPWTRTRRKNAVSLSAGGFFNFYMAAVSVCVCVGVCLAFGVCAVLQDYPERCYCIQTDVACVEVNLHDVPLLSPNVTWL